MKKWVWVGIALCFCFGLPGAIAQLRGKTDDPSARSIQSLAEEALRSRHEMGKLLSRDFVSVVADHANNQYTPGQSATFTISVNINPSNPDFSLDVSASFPRPGQTITLTQAGTDYLFQTPTLPAGTPEFRVDVRLDDNALITADENSIAKIDAQESQIQTLINNSTDPTTITNLKGQLAQLEALKDSLSTDIENAKSLVQTADVKLTVAVPVPLPPDPKTVAPALSPTIVTTVATGNSFLYTGSNPIQTGVAAGTIQPTKIAVISGQVETQSGSPLPGVTVAILNHPELGQTLSRADGAYTLAVNGGKPLTVTYTLAGYTSSQRQTRTPWAGYVGLDPVVLLQPDTNVTAISVGANSPAQTAQGSVITDQSGTRQASVIFPSGTQATMVLPDGSTQPMTTMNVRATELTVGPNGPQAMPATLPNTSAYTYAVHLTADEAVAAGATSIHFNQPVIHYVNNFLNIPVGTTVPVGYYDPAKGVWVPESNGAVVQMVSVTNGLANIALKERGKISSNAELAKMGITQEERRLLARLYQAPTTLWRAPLMHFSDEDENFPGGGEPNPGPTDPLGDPPPDGGPCGGGDTTDPGCIIQQQTRILKEQVPIVGTPFTLNYASNRTPGRISDRTVLIPITGATVDPKMAGVDLFIYIGGQKVFEKDFQPTPNQQYSYTWDGNDAYGRPLQGAQTATIVLNYLYNVNYGQPYPVANSFGLPPQGTLPVESRTLGINAILSQVQLGASSLAPISQGLGGWSLNVVNDYDANGGSLYMGNGHQITFRPANLAVSVAAGTGSRSTGHDKNPRAALTANISPAGLALKSDGGILFADSSAGEVEELLNGTITSIATGLNQPTGVVKALDGSIVVTETGANRVSQISSTGSVTVIAGGGTASDANGPIPATQALLSQPGAIAQGPDGTFYVSDANGIHYLRTDGTIVLVPDSQSATSIAVDPSGQEAYVASGTTLQVVSPQLTSINLYSGPNTVTAVAVNSSGRVFYSTSGASGSGLFEIINGNSVLLAPGGAGALSLLVAPNNTIYASGGNQILQGANSFPTNTGSAFSVASSDGSEIYDYNSQGVQIDTRDAYTNATKYQFTYDTTTGLLSSITDVSGNVTKITRDALGNPISITSPFGQQTLLSVDANGFLSTITNPNNETYKFVYQGATGLMTQETDPMGQSSSYVFTADGHLQSEQNAAGAIQSFAGQNAVTGTTTQYTSGTGLSVQSTIAVDSLGDQNIVNHLPDGTQQSHQELPANGEAIDTAPDGSVTQSTQAPDPRFGLQAPVASTTSILTPAGVSFNSSSSRTVTTSSPTGFPFTLSQMDVQNGKSTLTSYSSATGTFSTTSPEGRVSGRTLDNLGRTSQVTPAGLTPVQYFYNSLGQLASTTQGNRVTTYTYNPQGFLESSEDALNEKTSYLYDAAGRVTQTTLPDGRMIMMSYDPDGNLKSLTPPGELSHTFDYTPLNQEQDYIPPTVSGQSDSIHYVYNADRKISTITKPDGTQVQYQYSTTTGQLQSLSSGISSIGYTYNPTTGQLSAVTTTTGENMSYLFDGQLKLSTTWSGPVSGSVSNTYNADFQPATESVDSANTVNLSYDKDGLQTESGSESITRDPTSGLVSGTSLPPVADTYGYNGFGEVTSYSAMNGSTPLYSASYTRDELGRIQSRTETIAGASNVFGYFYDFAGRLTSVTENGAPLSTYSYTSNSNRQSLTQSSGALTGNYDAQDRLVSYGDFNYSYTPNGELETKTQESTSQKTQYAYDFQGNLESVTMPDGTVISYVIDGNGNRVGKKVGSTLQNGFLYSNGSGRLTAELDSSGNVLERFVYGSKSNIPDYMIKSGVTYRIISDFIGSPRLIVNTTDGSIAEQLSFDEFGNVLSDSSPGFQPFGFAGCLYDQDTKLCHFGAREYDPYTGRWMQKDPTGFNGGDTNLYGYVLTDPVNKSDSAGTWPDGPPQVPDPCLQEAVSAFAGCFEGALGLGGLALTLKEGALAACLFLPPPVDAECISLTLNTISLEQISIATAECSSAFSSTLSSCNNSCPYQ